jgi:hypothetical protein
MRKATLPSKADWGDYKSDLDVRYAYRLYGGQTVDQSIQYFIDNPIERASELRFAPFPIFRYYVYCFTSYLTSAQAAGESDMASVFLRLTRDMSVKHPAEFAEFYPQIRSAVEQVAGNQAFFDADVDIYGSFEEIRAAIEANANADPANGR